MATSPGSSTRSCAALCLWDWKFTVDGKEIKTVSEFWYLGRVVKDDDTAEQRFRAASLEQKENGRDWVDYSREEVQIQRQWEFCTKSLYKLYCYMGWNHGLSERIRWGNFGRFIRDAHEISHGDTFGKRRMGRGLTHRVRRYWRKLVCFQSRITFKNARIQSSSTHGEGLSWKNVGHQAKHQDQMAILYGDPNSFGSGLRTTRGIAT